MDKLTKAQKDELATSFAVLALYDGGAEISSGQISALLEATGNKEVEAFYPIIFANFLSNPDKVATLIATPGAGSGGGGGGGGAAAGPAAAEEVKEEEKEEEERKPTWEVELICSVEVVAAETTKNSSDNLHRLWGLDILFWDFLLFVRNHFRVVLMFFLLV